MTEPTKDAMTKEKLANAMQEMAAWVGLHRLRRNADSGDDEAKTDGDDVTTPMTKDEAVRVRLKALLKEAELHDSYDNPGGYPPHPFAHKARQVCDDVAHILALMDTHVLVPSWLIPVLVDAAQTGIDYKKTLVGLANTTPLTNSKLRIIKGWQTAVDALKEAYHGD